MYRTCIFCHSPLGANEVVERFPVGRRLAFDEAKGRLWVVCRRCERWNLTPLEERWEAIEACERLFRDTRLRVSTDNVGLARLAEGLELVRIGRPQRPEFAAWRYGDQFGRRRRRAIATGAAAAGAVVAGGALVASGPLVGMAAGSMISVVSLLSNAYAIAAAKRGELRVPHPERGHLHLSLNQVHEARLLPRAEGAGWALELPYASHRLPEDGMWQALKKRTNITTGRLILEGPHAELAAGILLPRINGAGAPRRRVSEAVALIERAGGPERFFADAAGRTREWAREQLWGDTGALRFLPPPVRLALEMAAHEDAERAALEGELALLEEAWRDAEEVAAIADDLLLPDRVRAKVAELARKG